MKKEKTALLVIDILNDFVYGALGCERAKGIVKPVARLVKAAHQAHVPVIFCNDAHYACDKELKLWGPHAMRGTKGAEVVPEIGVKEGDYVISKRCYSGFFQTDLDLLLKDLGIETVILTGLHAHMCVRHTAADAYQSGYEVVACTDGMDSFTKEDYDMGIRYLKDVYGAKLLTVAELVEFLTAKEE